MCKQAILSQFEPSLTPVTWLALNKEQPSLYPFRNKCFGNRCSVEVTKKTLTELKSYISQQHFKDKQDF